MELECNGMESVGCIMQTTGTWVGNFLNSFGDPYVSILFLFLMAVTLLIFGYMVKNAFE